MRTLLTALLGLLLAGLAPAFAQNTPAWTPPSATGAWEVPLDEIPGAPAERKLLEADYGHGILLRGDADYVRAMTRLLDSMALLPSGAEILEGLGESGYSTTIRPLGSRLGPSARPVDPVAAALVVDEEGRQTPGPGSDALVFMDPDSTIPLTTPEILLGHELLHALHYHRGERLNERQSEGPNAGTKLEELRTIGTDGYDHEEFSENELRGEWNALYPERPVAPERNGHLETDFGPSRSARGHDARGCECGAHALSPLEVAGGEGVAETLSRSLGPTE